MTKPNGKPCSRCGIRPKIGKMLCDYRRGRCQAEPKISRPSPSDG